MKIQENVDLTEFNTLNITSRSRFYTVIKSAHDIIAAYNHIKESRLNFFVLGGGSNVLLPELYDGLILHNKIKGTKIISEDTEYIYVRACSGVNWDEFVEYAIKNGFYGLENLSSIPGTVGAAPVQNISAYGSEIKEFIYSVEVFDVSSGKIINLPSEACSFKYRNSIFKFNQNMIVISVTFRLLKKETPNISYKDLSEAVKEKKITNVTAKDLRNLVIEIRKNKLPDYKTAPNAGSFFHNPIITHDKALELNKSFGAPFFKSESGDAKLSAGWLIENSGLKGYRKGNVGVYDKHALVLINHGKSTQKEFLRLAEYVRKKVYEKFGVVLTIEPIIVCQSISLGNLKELTSSP